MSICELGSEGNRAETSTPEKLVARERMGPLARHGPCILARQACAQKRTGPRGRMLDGRSEVVEFPTGAYAGRAPVP